MEGTYFLTMTAVSGIPCCDLNVPSVVQRQTLDWRDTWSTSTCLHHRTFGILCVAYMHLTVQMMNMQTRQRLVLNDKWLTL